MELDLDALLTEALQIQARRNADRTTKRTAQKAGHRADQAREASLDYAGRLAERAVFRRLLSDSAFDAARFQWWFQSSFGADGRSLDEWRRFIDHQMTKEKKQRT